MEKQLVWQDTCYQFGKDGKYHYLTPEESSRYQFAEEGLEFVSQKDSEIFSQINTHIAGGLILEVENTDTVSCLLDLQKYGENPLVLNMACESGPGGGVKRGASAQEEDLFRVSNYHLTLDSDFYPIDGAVAIYSPLVHIIKDSKYENLDHPVYASFIAVSAIKDPRPFSKSARVLTASKIDLIFRVAQENGFTSLLLGALGCGAYHNPPHEIVRLFAQSIAKWGSQFTRITFAVLANRTYTDENNYTIFHDHLVEQKERDYESRDDYASALFGVDETWSPIRSVSGLGRVRAYGSESAHGESAHSESGHDSSSRYDSTMVPPRDTDDAGSDITEDDWWHMYPTVGGHDPLEGRIRGVMRRHNIDDNLFFEDLMREIKRNA
jgi:uncharacterized protein (TIGR02452 family)